MIRAVEGRPHSGGSYGPGLGPAGISLENVPGSTAACAGPALGGGPARRHPIPPQSAQPKDFTDQHVAATAATALGCHQRSHPQRTWILVEDSSTETAKRPWRSPPSLGRASRGRISSQIRGSLIIFQVLHKQHVKSRSGQRIAHRCVRGTTQDEAAAERIKSQSSSAYSLPLESLSSCTCGADVPAFAK